MKHYLEISITSPPSQRDLLIATMVELGCRGFHDTDTELLCYFDSTDWSRAQTQRLETDIRRMLRTISSNADVRLRTIEEVNWNEQWKRTIQPIEVGEKIAIKPSWATYENKHNRIVIQIDPKMSFGTGYHESTRLMLRLLEKYVKAGYSLLDVGTGTGILAITAVKLGVARAVGIDVDEWSLSNAAENVSINDVADRVLISNQPLDRLPARQFDLIAANMTLNTIIELLPEIVKRLKRPGVILLSGLLRNDEQALQAVLSSRGYTVAETISENEWIAVVIRENG